MREYGKIRVSENPYSRIFYAVQVAHECASFVDTRSVLE